MAGSEHDIEQGFGTGLRAQLEKRREPDESTPHEETPAPVPVPDPAAAAVAAVPAAGGAASHEEVDALRRELYEALNREQDARSELAGLQARL